MSLGPEILCRPKAANSSADGSFLALRTCSNFQVVSLANLSDQVDGETLNNQLHVGGRSQVNLTIDKLS